MGSHSKKRKKTPDIKVEIAEIKQEADLDSISLAIQPVFEGTVYMSAMRTAIDFVNVTETIDPSQTPA